MVSQWWIQKATGSSSIRFLPLPWSYLLWNLFGADNIQWNFTEYSGIRNWCILHQKIILNCDLQLLLPSEDSILLGNSFYVYVGMVVNKCLFHFQLDCCDEFTTWNNCGSSDWPILIEYTAKYIIKSYSVIQRCAKSVFIVV